MAERLAQDIPEGWYVNLGIGIPLLVSNFVPADREVIFQSENGIVGMGPLQTRDNMDTWIVNAGKQNVTLKTGASIVHHADSFAMIRGGHLDLCVLGSFEVAANGDFANWTTGTVSGTKYNDVDGDGVIPEGGELGLQGWRIYVDYNNNSVWDNPAEPSAVSDVNGNYSITGVDPGNWNLREVAQLGWTQTSPAGGAPHAITVQSNGSVTNRNFGNFQLASISGQKFRDTDGDGLADNVDLNPLALPTGTVTPFPTRA